MVLWCSLQCCSALLWCAIAQWCYVVVCNCNGKSYAVVYNAYGAVLYCGVQWFSDMLVWWYKYYDETLYLLSPTGYFAGRNVGKVKCIVEVTGYRQGLTARGLFSDWQTGLGLELAWACNWLGPPVDQSRLGDCASAWLMRASLPDCQTEWRDGLMDGLFEYCI